MSAEREVINCPNAPPAIGPYSHAVRANGMIYVSGCIGVSPETKLMVEGGVASQARQVLDNVKAIVTHAGSDMSKVVKCTVLLTDIKDFPIINPIYGEYFPENPPARATFAVSGLPGGALIEIDCIAIA